MLVQSASEIKEIAKELSRHTIVALDTEFIREKTFFPELALIQVATKEDSWLIDPLALSTEDMEPLLEVFENKNILKLIHAAFADQEVLYWEYDCLAEPVLDTAVAAALCGLGDQRGLDSLLKETLNCTIKKGRARAKWLTRPLPTDLMEYARTDVDRLVEMGEDLIRRLEACGRKEWAIEESRVLVEDFDPSVESIAKRLSRSRASDKKMAAVLYELVEWRENRAKQVNIPRNWVASNDTLLSLAKSRPRSEAELRTFRGLKEPEMRKSGQAIVEAIKRGMESPRMEPAEVSERRVSDKEKRILDFVMTFVAFMAEKKDIAPRFILTSKSVERVLSFYEQTDIDWVKAGVLSTAAEALIGDDLKRVLRGEYGLAIRSQELQAVKYET